MVGFDIDAAKRKELAKAGVEIARDAAAVAAAAPIVITSLPKPEALLATAKAIAAAGLPRRIIAECSTFTIEDKEKAEKVLRAAGHVMLDCPVSGTGSQARTGDLVIYASGDRKAIGKVKPMFAGFSRKTLRRRRLRQRQPHEIRRQPAGRDQQRRLGRGHGARHEGRASIRSTIFEMISNGAGNSRVFELRAPMMVKNDYSDVTMKCSVWQKDMDVIGAFAKKMRVPTPLFSATLPVYAAALKSGHANDDTAAVCAVLEAKGRRQAPQGADMTAGHSAAGIAGNRAGHCRTSQAADAVICRAGSPPSLM